MDFNRVGKQVDVKSSLENLVGELILFEGTYSGGYWPSCKRGF